MSIAPTARDGSEDASESGAAALEARGGGTLPHPYRLTGRLAAVGDRIDDAEAHAPHVQNAVRMLAWWPVCVAVAALLRWEPAFGLLVVMIVSHATRLANPIAGSAWVLASVLLSAAAWALDTAVAPVVHGSAPEAIAMGLVAGVGAFELATLAARIPRLRRTTVPSRRQRAAAYVAVLAAAVISALAGQVVGARWSPYLTVAIGLAFASGTWEPAFDPRALRRLVARAHFVILALSGAALVLVLYVAAQNPTWSVLWEEEARRVLDGKLLGAILFAYPVGAALAATLGAWTLVRQARAVDRARRATVRSGDAQRIEVELVDEPTPSRAGDTPEDHRARGPLRLGDRVLVVPRPGAAIDAPRAERPLTPADVLVTRQSAPGLRRDLHRQAVRRLALALLSLAFFVAYWSWTELPPPGPCDVERMPPPAAAGSHGGALA